MYLVNGESKQNIACSDRGLQYGDGLFETIEVQNGTPVFLKQHLKRLHDGCRRLLLPIPEDNLIRQEIFQLLSICSKESAVLKIMMTRGSGGRGYRQPELINHTRILSVHPFPNYSEKLIQQGINARFCDTRLGHNPSLAGIKHLNRLEQVMARAEWNSSEIHEGLMMDIQGNVVEGTMSNIFLIKQGCLFTSPIKQCGIEGVLRNILIKLARDNQITVMEQNISQNEVLTADTVFVTNSIIGLWPIKKINQQQFEISPIINQLNQYLQAFKQEDIQRG